MTAFAGDIQVRRFKGGVPQGPALPLTDVSSGPNQWLKVSGNGSTDSISLTPTDPQFDYELSVNGLAIAGTQDAEAPNLHRAWVEKKDLAAGSAASML